MEDKLPLALTHANVYTRLEHHTVRYVMMLLQIIFFDEKFNIFPQFCTWSVCYPDIALETCYNRPGSWRNRDFVCIYFFEAKPGASSADPFVLLRQGISMEYGVLHFYRGLLIGIVGLTWRFLEYPGSKYLGQIHHISLPHTSYRPSGLNKRS